MNNHEDKLHNENTPHKHVYKNEDILNPPGYKPSEQEIALAKANYVMKNYIYSMLNQLSTYHDMQQGIMPKHGTVERHNDLAAKAVTQWKETKNNWKTSSVFDAFLDDKDFKEHCVDGLSAMHLGDCTSFPATCDRCYAEGLFNVDSTVTWTQKEGDALLAEYCADYEAKNP